MKKLITLCLACAACACAAGPTATTTTPASTATVAPPAVAAPVTDVGPRYEGTLPDQPAALVSIDPKAVQALLFSLSTRLAPSVARRLEGGLGLASASLADAALLSSAGIDEARPIVVAVARISPSTRSVLDTARAQIDRAASRNDQSPRDLAKTIGKALYAQRAPHAQIRVILPARDTVQLLRRAHALLAARGYRAIGTAPGFESIHARRERAVALSVLPDRLVVDILVFSGGVPRAPAIVEAASEVRNTLLATRGQAPLPLDGRGMSVRYTPALLAELGFVEAVSRAYDELPQGHSSTRDWRMLRGLREAGALWPLVEGPHGAYFDAAELQLDLLDGFPKVELSTTLGTGVKHPAEADCAPSTSVSFPNALARFDLATSCMRAMEAPGDPATGNLVSSQFGALVEEMPWVGWPIAVHAYALGATRQPLRWNAGVGSRAIMRFERFGWANPAFGAPDVFWGLLPAGATAEQVACAVDELGDRCRGMRRIQPHHVNDIGGFYARVVSVSGRVVILTSRDRVAVTKLAPVLTQQPAPPMRGVVSTGTMQRVLRGLGLSASPIRYEGDVRVEGNRMVIRAGPGD